MIPASPLALRDRATIAHLLLKRGTPSICAFREVMEAGALMSHGVNLVDVFRDIAAFADQVARGAKACDVPMRAPSHFHTAFNLKTAKALGLDLPPTLLARADEVIESRPGWAEPPARAPGRRDRRSVFPEVSKPIRRKLSVSDGVLDVLVTEIVLQRPSIHTLIGQLEPS